MTHRGYSGGMSLLLISFALASAPARTADVAIVPGCPSSDDGTLSHCQQRRVAWAGRLWAEGRVANVITSGAAVCCAVSPDGAPKATAAAVSPRPSVHLQFSVITLFLFTRPGSLVACSVEH